MRAGGALVGADTDGPEPTLGAEFDEAALARFDVPAPDVGAGRGCPATALPTFDRRSGETVQWLSAGGAGSDGSAIADYTERYFALTSITGEISDSTLFQAIRELAEGRPGRAAGDLTLALRPALTDAHACDRAARTLRRTASLSAELSGSEAAAVLPYVFEQFGYLRVPAAGGFGPDEEATVWLAALLQRPTAGRCPPPWWAILVYCRTC